MRDTLIEYARHIVIPLDNRIGQFVRVQLNFDSKWMMISEVQFDSGTFPFTFIFSVVSRSSSKQSRRELIFDCGGVECGGSHLGGRFRCKQDKAGFRFLISERPRNLKCDPWVRQSKQRLFTGKEKCVTCITLMMIKPHVAVTSLQFRWRQTWRRRCRPLDWGWRTTRSCASSTSCTGRAADQKRLSTVTNYLNSCFAEIIIQFLSCTTDIFFLKLHDERKKFLTVNLVLNMFKKRETHTRSNVPGQVVSALCSCICSEIQIWWFDF